MLRLTDQRAVVVYRGYREVTDAAGGRDVVITGEHTERLAHNATLGPVERRAVEALGSKSDYVDLVFLTPRGGK